MTAIRAPLERGNRGIEAWWARLLQRRMRRAGLLVPDQVIGLAWTGAFDAGQDARRDPALAAGG